MLLGVQLSPAVPARFPFIIMLVVVVEVKKKK